MGSLPNQTQFSVLTGTQVWFTITLSSKRLERTGILLANTGTKQVSTRWCHTQSTSTLYFILKQQGIIPQKEKNTLLLLKAGQQCWRSSSTT